MPTDKHAAAAEVLDSFAEASESIERIPFASPEGLPAPVVEESEESSEEPPLRSLANGEDGDGAGSSGSAVSPSAEVWSDETNGAHSAGPTAGGDGDDDGGDEEVAGEEAAVAAAEEEEEEGEAEAEEEDEASDFVFEPPPASEAQLEQRRGSWNEQSLLLRVSAMSAADVKEWAREASTAQASSTAPPTHSHGIPALRGMACPRDLR